MVWLGPASWTPRHRLELVFLGLRETQALSAGGTEEERMDSSPEAAGGRAITESRATGDEKTWGHGSAGLTQRQEPSLRLAGPPGPIPKPRLRGLGCPGRAGLCLSLQTDQTGPRPARWGIVIHFSLVLPPSSPASFWKFSFQALASPRDLQGLAPSRHSVDACWQDESVLSGQR